MKLACGRFRSRRVPKRGLGVGGHPAVASTAWGRQSSPKQPLAGLHVGPGSRSAGSASLSGLAGCQQAAAMG